MGNRAFWVAVSAMGLLAGIMSLSQPEAKAQGRREVDERRLVTLRGNTRPEANAQMDRGAVNADVRFEHMLLLLQRPPEVEQALAEYIEGLNNKNSPNYHHWLTAAEIGQKYGVAQDDLGAVTDWLGSHGLTVNKVYTNRVVIDFSGTAKQIHEAFHTSIHRLKVGTENHMANMSDPQIPEALAPVIKGVFSLNDFKPFAMHKSAADFSFAGCSRLATGPGTCYAMTPQDNQTIYGLTPLYAAGISGRGQTIVLLEDTDLYSAGDWNTYRKVFGLARTYPYGTLAQIHPDCDAPGANGDDGEAAIDVEVASAIAPNAAIQLVACPSGDFTFGGLIALQNMINDSATPPAIVSMSYGLCEAVTGPAGTAGFYSTFQQAAAEGVSVFVSSGDELSSSCANLFGVGYAVPGIGVTGWGETPYNVSVGGTDFADTYLKANSTYWNATNSASYGSAKSYIPEIPWNDSCADPLIATYVKGPGTVPYGSTGFCNVSPGNSTSGYLSIGGASGGPSNCATGFGGVNQTNQAIVFGSCQGYPKPSWQAIYGNPADGVRDIPDISMFAANGIWGHYEVVCWSDPNFTSDGAAPCTGTPNTWAGFGGTSVSAPTMAAIQALVNQKTNQRWGNPDPIYYQLANTQFGADGSLASACDSDKSGGPAAGCVFNDVTLGSIDVVCRANGTIISNCYRPSGTNGVLSTNKVASYVAGSSTSSNPILITGGTGYTSAPTCTIASPSNLAPFSLNGTTLYAGGTQATCTTTINPGSINAVGAIQVTQPLFSDGVGNDGYGIQVGSSTYYFVTSLSGGPNEILEPTSGTTAQQETRLALNIEAAINANSAQCFAAPCFSSGMAANTSATATVASTVVTLNATAAGYAGNFTVATVPLFGPFYLAASGGNNGAGPGYVSNITVADGGGVGYGPNSACTISGGGGSGALCVASVAPNVAPASYQPAFGATPGWDFATGIGTPNAYNLVMNWPTGP